MPDFENEKNLFLNSNLVKGIKFKTLEYYYDAQLLVFKDTVLNFMWHAWLASVQRDDFVLVPIQPTQEMIKNATREFYDLDIDDIEDRIVFSHQAMIEAQEQSK